MQGRTDNEICMQVSSHRHNMPGFECFQSSTIYSTVIFLAPVLTTFFGTTMDRMPFLRLALTLS